MANSITKAKQYAAMLDKAAEHASLTSILQVPDGMVRPGIAAGSFLIAKQSLVGLGTYSPATGFPVGDVTLTWEEFTYSKDRGRTFSVDAMDNVETAGQAFGQLAAEFVRTKVVPEVDAYRFATIATAAGQDAYGILDSSAEWVAAVDTAIAGVGDAGVDQSNLVLFTTYSGVNYLKNSTIAARLTQAGDNPDARVTMWDGIQVVPVPTNRFYGEISLNAGSSSSAGGYVNAGGAINFILMDKSAAFCDLKHAPVRIFAPDVNQTADAWKFDYRAYHDCFVFDNKAEAIYVHGATDIVS
jgi:hypothetical protein